MGWRPSLFRLEAIAFRLEAIASRLEAIAIRNKLMTQNSLALKLAGDCILINACGRFAMDCDHNLSVQEVDK